MSKLSHLSTVSDLGLDSLVRLARLRFSPMDFLVVTVELVLAGETLLVVFAVDDRAFEALGIDAVLGRVVTFHVAEAFSGEFAVGFTASIISRLAIMKCSLFMPQQSS